MGIDVFFCTQEGGEIKQEGDFERVANVDGFLVMAYMFGIVLEPIREMVEEMPEGMEVDPQTFRQAIEQFEQYVEENRERGIENFERYYEFLKDQAEMMKAQGMKNVFGPPVVEQLPLEAIDEDSQAFFGWFMLSERVIGPEEAGLLAPIIGAARGMFTAYAEASKEENPNLAGMMNDAYECLGVAARFCDTAAAGEKSFFFSV